MTFLAPVTLEGRLTTLEPLSHEHHDGLVEAARDGELWNLWYTSVPRPGDMSAEIGRRLELQASGSMLPFAARRNDTTHWMNQQSRTAIARLGAKQDGVLRNHKRMADGSLRDTVVFSIIESEWPAVRNELQRRLAVHR